MTDRKNEIPRISDAEWQVMREFWARGEATASDVVAALEPDTDWKPKTIQTLIRRLTQKGALGFEKVGREYLYRPLVDEKSCEQAVSEQFLDRVFDGRLAPFLANFVESNRFSREEINELKRMLDQNMSD
mgnify:CR=1 FL=1